MGDNAFDDDYDEDGDDGFDANELLNFDDYKNKRKTQPPAPVVEKKKSPPRYVKNDYDFGEDDWGDDWGNDDDELDNFDYNNANLNKLTDHELDKHKKKMDEKFNANNLKPGDSGFEYDKRVDFSAM